MIPLCGLLEPRSFGLVSIQILPFKTILETQLCSDLKAFRDQVKKQIEIAFNIDLAYKQIYFLDADFCAVTNLKEEVPVFVTWI